MEVVKRQHYVPQFYLRLFSSDKKSIGLYNIKQKKIVPAAPIKGQCYENFFYDKDGKIEGAIRDLEDVSAPILKDIASKKEKPKDKISLFRILLFLSLQKLRTQAIAEDVNRWADKVFKQLIKANGKLDHINSDHYSVTHKNAVHISMQSWPTYTVLLGDMDWAFIESKPESFFITSDSPIVAYSIIPKKSVGIALRGLILFYPIDSNLCLMLYDKTTYKIGTRRNKIILANASEVDQINCLQYIFARENIYFKYPEAGSQLSTKLDKFFELRDMKVVDSKEYLNIDDPNKKLVYFKNRYIDINLNLSFVSKVSVKNIEKYNWGSLQVRNRRLVEATETFEKMVKEGKAKPGQLFDFISSLGLTFLE